MPEALAGVIVSQAGDDDKGSPQRAGIFGFAKVGLTALTTTLLLGAGGALAICPCGDGVCGGPPTCFPPETPQTCAADCAPPEPQPPAELTVRVKVIPFGDPGRVNIHIDNTTFATNKGEGQETGPHILTAGPHTLSVTAGGGTDLADYRTTICGACSAAGAIQPGVRQSCSITNLRLPTPGPAPGCQPECLSALLQCSGSGETPEFCNDVFHRCLNGCQIPSARRFTIARFASPGMPSVNLTERDADSVLADMSDVLRTSHGPDDLECNVAFCRDGTVEEFAIDDGVVNSEAEQNAVFALPQDIKAVRGIFFCDGFRTAAGCSNGDSMIVRIRFLTSLLDAINWAHEYGHIRGLGHRDDPNAIMLEGTTGSSQRVTPAECTPFRAFPSLASAAAATNPSAPPANIKDFVRQVFIHGVPYEAATRYGPDVVPTLLAMLADPREKQAWPNIVILLGMLGDERAVIPLISLVESNPEDELDYSEYDAKTNAIFGLGYLVNKSGNQEALSYLRDGSDPSAWLERGITWTSPEHETAAERDRQLSGVAIIGLGLSGDPSAEEALRDLLIPAPTPTEKEFRERMSGVIWEALRANRRIAAEGLAAYYRESAR
jgi:hypothetical protein